MIKKINSPTLIWLLLISIIINCILIAIFAKRKLDFIAQQKATEKSIKYMNDRQSIYEKLPIDSSDIVFIGDSQTQRFPVSEFFDNFKVKNRGIEGDNTFGVLNRIDPIIISHPSKIFVQVGINDLLREGQNVNKALVNFNLIVSRIIKESPKTNIYVGNVFPTNHVSADSILKYNVGLKTISKKHNLTFIDVYESFSSNGSLNPKFDCGDGLHLNGNGYVLWKKILSNYL